MQMTKFNSGIELVEIPPQSGGPKTLTVAKIIDCVRNDARFPAQQAANMIDISNGSTLDILQNVLKTNSKSASWALHFHIEDQKQRRVKISKKLLITFPLYN